MAKKKSTVVHNTTNRCLLAPPHLKSDYFSNALLYVARHDKEGALGLIINRPNSMPITTLFEDLDINAMRFSPPNSPLILEGGPVRPDIGLVLHTGLPTWNSSLPIAENICLTSSKDILQAIADNAGVGHYQISLGFAAWTSLQLEKELSRGDWLVCDADLALLFDTPYELRWKIAAEKLGLNPMWLSEDTGHA